MENKKIKDVIVPLSVDEVKEFFTNKNLLYYVNYAESSLKGVVFLTYISNLDLPAEINFDGTNYEDKAQLFKIYMETRNIIPCETFRLNLAKILLDYKGVDTSGIFVNLVFTQEEIKQFINENSELLDRWEQFLDSTPVFAISAVEDLKATVDIENNFKVVDDMQFVGANIVNLFSIPMFMETYFSLPPRKELCYFKPQFEEYMFRGKNFFSYFDTDENSMLHMFMAHVNGLVSLKDINQATEEAKTILGE